MMTLVTRFALKVEFSMLNVSLIWRSAAHLGLLGVKSRNCAWRLLSRKIPDVWKSAQSWWSGAGLWEITAGRETNNIMIPAGRVYQRGHHEHDPSVER